MNRLKLLAILANRGRTPSVCSRVKKPRQSKREILLCSCAMAVCKSSAWATIKPHGYAELWVETLLPERRFLDFCMIPLPTRLLINYHILLEVPTSRPKALDRKRIGRLQHAQLLLNLLKGAFACRSTTGIDTAESAAPKQSTPTPRMLKKMSLNQEMNSTRKSSKHSKKNNRCFRFPLTFLKKRNTSTPSTHLPISPQRCSPWLRSSPQLSLLASQRNG